MPTLLVYEKFIKYNDLKIYWIKFSERKGHFFDNFVKF